MALTITTFNIQTFGGNRSSQKDRLEQVAVAILLLNPAPDIIGLVEITESDPADACELVKLLCATISNPPKYSKLNGRNYKYLISEYNGFESYVFLYNPNTVTSVVFDIDNEIFFENTYYTLDDDQPSSYIELNQIVFKLNGNNDNTTTKKVKIIGDWKTCMYNTFPLIHFHNRSTCRPPGLGLFKQGNNFFGVLLWHNMSGDDSPSYSYMYHLAQSVIVKNQTFDIWDGSKTMTIRNLIVTGDFNVDEISASSNNPDPYAEFTNNGMNKLVSGNNALSLLNYYRADWKYPNDGPVLTKAFDNIFYRCAQFNLNQGGINNLGNIFMNKKKYVLDFLSQSKYIGGNDDYDPEYYIWNSVKNHPFAKYVYSKMSGIKENKKPIFDVSERKIVALEFLKERKGFREKKDPELTKSREILSDRFDKFYDEAFNIYIAPTEFRATRYIKIKDYGHDLTDGDIIFFLRQFISDHLPVTISFH